MKFKIYKTSEIFNEIENDHEFNTLEELLEWCKDTENEVIINSTEMSLEIYDSYRE